MVDIFVGDRGIERAEAIASDHFDASSVGCFADGVGVDQHRGRRAAVGVQADAVADLGTGAIHGRVADRVALNGAVERSRKASRSREDVHGMTARSGDWRVGGYVERMTADRIGVILLVHIRVNIIVRKTIILNDEIRDHRIIEVVHENAARRRTAGAARYVAPSKRVAGYGDRRHRTTAGLPIDSGVTRSTEGASSDGPSRCSGADSHRQDVVWRASRCGAENRVGDVDVAVDRGARHEITDVDRFVGRGPRSVRDIAAVQRKAVDVGDPDAVGAAVVDVHVAETDVCGGAKQDAFRNGILDCAA